MDAALLSVSLVKEHLILCVSDYHMPCTYSRGRGGSLALFHPHNSMAICAVLSTGCGRLITSLVVSQDNGPAVGSTLLEANV